MAITIDIRDQATVALKGLREGLEPGELNKPIARAELFLFQNHFLSLGQNKRGWPSQHLYSQFSKATNATVVADGVYVSINHIAARQRVFGGVIRPVTKKYLAIPAREEAYGKKPGEFKDLRVVFGRGGVPVGLAEYESSEVSFGKVRKNGSRKVIPGKEHGFIMFWLTKQVNQAPDPNVLPTDQQIGDAAIKVVEDVVDRAIRRENR